MATNEITQDWAYQYGVWKWEISRATGASEDLLHVHIGLALFVLSALLFRRRLASPLPLVIVIIFALLNEAIDIYDETGPLDLEPLVDIANTIFWPFMLFLIARRRLLDRRLDDADQAEN